MKHKHKNYKCCSRPKISRHPRNLLVVYRTLFVTLFIRCRHCLEAIIAHKCVFFSKNSRHEHLRSVRGTYFAGFTPLCLSTAGFRHIVAPIALFFCRNTAKSRVSLLYKAPAHNIAEHNCLHVITTPPKQSHTIFLTFRSPPPLRNNTTRAILRSY